MFTFTKEILDNAFTYSEFMAFADDIFNLENPPAPYDNENYMNYSKSNVRWSQRLTKKLKLTEEIVNLVKSIEGTWNWVLINEPWCGDGAFSLAFLHNLSVASEGKINLKIVLRDENHPIMNEYLTNDGMAIPKLVCLDGELNEMLVWGSAT